MLNTKFLKAPSKRLFKKLVIIIQNSIVAVLKLYKRIVSPHLGQNCRFHPSCSEYTIHAVQTRGPIIGLFIGAKRLLRCNPLGGFGLDPLEHTKGRP